MYTSSAHHLGSMSRTIRHDMAICNRAIGSKFEGSICKDKMPNRGRYPCPKTVGARCVVFGLHPAFLCLSGQ
jgi:hypothetical protein